MNAPAIGTRVRVTSPAPPETGVGRSGIVVAVRQCESTITGRRLTWTECDIRLDNGALVTRQPNTLTRVAATDA